MTIIFLIHITEKHFADQLRSNPVVKNREAESQITEATLLIRAKRHSQRQKRDDPAVKNRGTVSDEREVILLLKTEKR